MTLNFIGIGLNDAKDISVKGLEIVQQCDVVYLESYTSKQTRPVSELEELTGKKIIIANRKMVEMDAEKTILEDSKTKEVGFLVVGDVFSATTHSDLYLRCKQMGIATKIVHNASVLTAIGVTGLQLYKFGKVVSIPWDNENVEVPYDSLKKNIENDLHTLFILDLKEDSPDSLHLHDAIRYLLKVELKRGEKVFTDSTLCVGCTKLGSADQIVKAGKANDVLKFDFKDGMQCLIVPSRKLHFMEEDVLKLYY